MNESYTYAQFWRCALQVNTFDYSRTYRGRDHGYTEADYNQAILEQCLSNNIKVIGLADHGSVESMEPLRTLLESRGIVVFPGFEIASTEKIHMVCLFPEGTAIDLLNRYLGKLDLTKLEDKVWPSKLSCLDIARIMKDDIGGFWYAAHMTGKNGLIRLQKDGGSFIHVWQDYTLVRAGQIPGSVADLPAAYQQIIEDKDPNWKRDRPIAVINAKDVAEPADLADRSATCLIKMTNPTFAAFKVAFLDPESRIRLNSATPEEPRGRVTSMRITAGYLDGVDIRFSDHLNTVIGGRGTGKSTLVECLRYVLDILPKGKQAQKLHAEIIKVNLGNASGRIEIDLVSSALHGKRYQVSRRFGEMPIVRDEQGQVSTLQPRDLLPGIEIYGQNEIYELARDEQSPLQLLDRFMPHNAESGERHAGIRKRLQGNQQKLAKTLGEIDDLHGQLALLPKLTEQLQGFQSLGIQEKLAKTPLLARERQIVQRAEEEFRRLREGLVTLQESLPDLTFISEKSLESLPNAAQLVPLRVTLDKLRTDFLQHLGELQSELSQGEEQWEIHWAAWRTALQQGEGELEKALRSLPATAGKSGQEVGTAYQRLLQEIERIKPLETQVAHRKLLLSTLEQERRNLRADLSDLRSQRSAELQSAAKRLNRQLEGKLKVIVVPDADRMPLQNFLLESHLEGIGEKRLAWINDPESLQPSMLAQAIQEGAAVLERDWKLTPLVAQALSQMPLSRRLDLEVLELGDRVEIELNVAHDEAPHQFKPLSRLSIGQQCTAILHLLLLENVDPLVVDQPEDNLDNAFIADRIVRELRRAKTHRQFLFSTHNANIPVFGDAEWIGVFSAVEGHGCLGLDAQGSIDVPVIRVQVADILEGGKAAFIQRKEKYEF